jgi:hypothetical protein
MDLEYQHINKICLNDHTHEPVSGDELDKAIDKLNRNKSVDISEMYGLILNFKMVSIIFNIVGVMDIRV